jgi:archaellum component FlaC
LATATEAEMKQALEDLKVFKAALPKFHRINLLQTEEIPKAEKALNELETKFSDIKKKYDQVSVIFLGNRGALI